MSDKRTHRGLHPQDLELFGASQLPALRLAVAELSWLLSRAYALDSALKLVGDRHNLRSRQRALVARAACTDEQRSMRSVTRRTEVAGQDVFIDGFNLLITVEAALSGGLIYTARDGAIRDLSSVHGAYRSVSETDLALLKIGEGLAAAQPRTVTWWFDQPVSNSGRLAQRVRLLAQAHGWAWDVRLAMNPDRELMAVSDGIIVSSDSVVMDHACGWWPLSEAVIRELPGHFHWLNFSAEESLHAENFRL